MVEGLSSGDAKSGWGPREATSNIFVVGVLLVGFWLSLRLQKFIVCVQLAGIFVALAFVVVFDYAAVDADVSVGDGW